MSAPLTGSNAYSVQRCSHYPTGATRDGWVVGYRCVAFPAHFTAESKTTTDESEAQAWADRLNAGEKVPEAGIAIYADRD